jgi:4'-phosphopantetheinyl transferase
MHKTEPQQVAVYAIKVDSQLERTLFDSLLTYVLPEKRERIKRFYHYEDALRALLGDLLVRHLISQQTGLPNWRLQFGRNEYGKPFLLNDVSIAYNISHSGEWVVGALATAAVGVDVEKVAPVAPRLAQRIFTPEEYQALITKNGPERRQYFYSLWTLKESLIKAVGKGLAIALDSFTIRIGRDGQITVDPEPECGRYFFKQYDWGKAYRLAVCAATNAFGDTVKIITLDDILARLG